MGWLHFWAGSARGNNQLLFGERVKQTLSVTSPFEKKKNRLKIAVGDKEGIDLLFYPRRSKVRWPVFQRTSKATKKGFFSCYFDQRGLDRDAFISSKTFLSPAENVRLKYLSRWGVSWADMYFSVGWRGIYIDRSSEVFDIANRNQRKLLNFRSSAVETIKKARIHVRKWSEYAAKIGRK